LQRHLSAGIDQKPVDLQPRLFAKLHGRIAAESHCQSGRKSGHDFLAEKNRRGPIKRAASRLKLTEGFARDLFD
jgi:hypothetical protein